MAKINSIQKGKAGEREFANLCKSHGFEKVRRSQQYAGTNNDADVVGLEDLHIEVKRVERLNIEKAMEQALSDKRESEMPIVAHRRDRCNWMVTMNFEDWMSLYKSYIGNKEEI